MPGHPNFTWPILRLCGRIVFILIAASLRAAVSNEDTQWWSTAELVAPIAHETTATFIGTERIGDNLPNPTLCGGGLLVSHRIDPWTLTAGDLWARIRNSNTGKGTNVQLPLIMLTYSWKQPWGAISDQNRVEELESPMNSTKRYRNQLLVDFVISHAGPISHVFLSDEAFYDLSTSRWNRNRAEVGLGVPLSRFVEFQFYLLRQETQAGSPRDIRAFGTTLIIKG
jgi:hypothetical protein